VLMYMPNFVTYFIVLRKIKVKLVWPTTKKKIKNRLSYFSLSGHYKVQLFDPRTNGFAPSSPGLYFLDFTFENRW
jgi:hypothetical protein